MSGFKVASIFSKFALLVAVSNGVFFISGLGSSYWQTGTTSTGDNVGYGLWMRCVETNSTVSCRGFGQFEGQGTQLDGDLRVSRGLLLTSYICLIITGVTCFIYIYTTKLHNKWMAFIVNIFAYGSVVLCLSGLIVYGNALVLPGFNLDWSFAMTVIGLIFNIAMAVLMTIDLKKSRKIEESPPPSRGIEETMSKDETINEETDNAETINEENINVQ